MVQLNKQEQEMVDGLPEALRAQVTASILGAKEATLKERSTFKIRVTPKGGLAVYTGLSRFPTTLYRAQWEVILQNQQVIAEAVKSLPERKAQA